jgi:hypothetical protein
MSPLGKMLPLGFTPLTFGHLLAGVLLRASGILQEKARVDMGVGKESWFMCNPHEHTSLPKATLVHCAVDNVPILHVHGIREEHLIICEAMGIDHAWYQGAAAGQNSLLSATPP